MCGENTLLTQTNPLCTDNAERLDKQSAKHKSLDGQRSPFAPIGAQSVQLPLESDVSIENLEQLAESFDCKSPLGLLDWPQCEPNRHTDSFGVQHEHSFAYQIRVDHWWTRD